MGIVSFKVAFYTVTAFIAIVILVSSKKSGHWFKAIIVTALSGFCALLSVNLLGAVSDVFIPINYYTVALSGLLGAPGTIFTLLVMVVFLQ